MPDARLPQAQNQRLTGDRKLQSRMSLVLAHRVISLRSEIDAINAALQIAASSIELPEIVVPEASPPPLNPKRQGLVFFDDDWITASRAMIRHKSYGK